MIQIRGLRFSYPHGNFDLDIPELEIPAAQSTAIVGPSGSGKTTLLHLIGGILKPTHGSVTVNNRVVNTLSDAEVRKFRINSVGLIFQEFALIDYLSVIENVLLPARINPSMPSVRQLRDRASLLLESVGLAEYAGQSVTRLSQGERQRVAICRALLPEPDFLLADEPTGNLDPATSLQILQLLTEAVSAQQTTLVMVTHDHSLLEHFDRTVDFAQFLTTSPAGVTS